MWCLTKRWVRCSDSRLLSMSHRTWHSARLETVSYCAAGSNWGSGTPQAKKQVREAKEARRASGCRNAVNAHPLTQSGITGKQDSAVASSTKSKQHTHTLKTVTFRTGDRRVRNHGIQATLLA